MPFWFRYDNTFGSTRTRRSLAIWHRFAWARWHSEEKESLIKFGLSSPALMAGLFKKNDTTPFYFLSVFPLIPDPSNYTSIYFSVPFLRN